MLEANTIAPDFELLDAKGMPQTLSQFLGHWVVLYFYPKDETPGCTAEACSFRDTHADFEKHDAKIIGINTDSQQSHKAFVTKHQLPFMLLSDPTKEVIKTYGAKGLFTKRISYLINPEGKIAKSYDNVDPVIHAKQILQDLEGLSNERS
ncbi:MAG: peroxiredoxin [Candidatus Falkowbacteria bacterium]